MELFVMLELKPKLWSKRTFYWFFFGTKKRKNFFFTL